MAKNHRVKDLKKNGVHHFTDRIRVERVPQIGYCLFIDDEMQESCLSPQAAIHKAHAFWLLERKTPPKF